MNPYSGHRYAQPIAGAPSPLDKLQQINNLQTSQAHEDMMQQQNAMQMLHSLYGIQQQQQMGPEQLRALQLSNQGQQYQNEQAPAMGAAKLQGMDQQRELNQSEIDLRNREKTGEVTPMQDAQIEERTGRPRPGSPRDLQMKQEQNDKAWSGMVDQYTKGVPTPDDDAAAMQRFGPTNVDYLHGLKPHAPDESTVPPQYRDRPEIQKLLQEQIRQKAEKPFDPGLEVEKSNLNRKVHPVNQFLKDLWNLYS